MVTYKVMQEEQQIVVMPDNMQEGDMKKIVQLLICTMLISAAMMVTSCEKKERTNIKDKEKVKNLQLPNEKGEFIDIDVYFDNSKNENKVEILNDEVLINKEELIGQVIVDQLIKGPSLKSKLMPVLPKETRLLSFSIKDSVAIVNLSKEAAVPMSKGKEEACLKSIAASLSQLSSISKVVILIENKNVGTLGGNFDISKPFGRDELIESKK
jgi:germination protein M